MRPSLMPVMLATALLFQGYGLPAALPMGDTEDSSFEQEVTSLLSDEMTDNGLNDADLSAGGKARGQKVIIVGNPSLWRDLQTLHSGLSFLKRTGDDNSKTIKQIPIMKRDMMRCMVGRVYRPCWEA